MAVQLSNSKLTPHNLIPNSATRPLMQAGAKGIKCVDDFGAADEAKKDNPVVITIGRRNSVYPTDQGRVITAENLRQAHNPEEAAIFYASVQEDVMRLNPFIDYWEGTNEPSWEVKVNNIVDRAATIANYEWYARFDIQLMKEREKRNKKAVIGCFSTGVPDINQTDQYQWIAYLPALQYANDHGHILGLHEYRNNIGRYRVVHDLVFVPHNLNNLKIVITEFSTDDDFTHDPDDIYIDKTIAADQEMRKDTYLLFATIFTYGSNNPAWNAYDRSRTPTVAQALANRVRSQIGVPDPTPSPVLPVGFVNGIDVSINQGTVDWVQVAKNNKYAFTRVGGGLYKDPTFDRNWAGIKAAGLIRGVYQYIAETVDGGKQADVLLTAIGGVYTPGDIPPVLDVEVDFSNNAILGQRVQEWVTRIKSVLGINPLIYTAQSFWDNHNLPNYGCELWVANYTPANKPLLPKAWTTYRFWQYNIGEAGSQAGISTKIDNDRYNGTLAELQKWVQAPVVPSPLPTGTPSPIFKFKVLDYIRTIVTLNVRTSPDLGQNNVIKSVPAGTKGYVMRNGVLSMKDGIIFFKILYDDDTYGWSSQNFLEKTI